MHKKYLYGTAMPEGLYWYSINKDGSGEFECRDSFGVYELVSEFFKKENGVDLKQIFPITELSQEEIDKMGLKNIGDGPVVITDCCEASELADRVAKEQKENNTPSPATSDRCACGCPGVKGIAEMRKSSTPKLDYNFNLTGNVTESIYSDGSKHIWNGEINSYKKEFITEDPKGGCVPYNPLATTFDPVIPAGHYHVEASPRSNSQFQIFEISRRISFDGMQPKADDGLAGWENLDKPMFHPGASVVFDKPIRSGYYNVRELSVPPSGAGGGDYKGYEIWSNSVVRYGST